MLTLKYVPMITSMGSSFISFKSLVNLYRQTYLSSMFSRRKFSKDQCLNEYDLKPTDELRPQFKCDGLDKEFVVRHLMKCVRCSQDEASKLLNEMPILRYRHLESVDNLINIFKQQGLQTNLLLDNPWLFRFSVSTLRPRVDLICKVGLTANISPLLKLTTRQLKLVITQWLIDEKNETCGSFTNRLEYLSHHLQCSEADIASLAVKHYSLMTTNFTKLSTVLTLLLKYNISKDDIKKNLDIFNGNIDQLKDRLQKAHLANIGQIKIWMLLCPHTTFQNTIFRWHDTKQELEYTDNTEYLAEKLQCSPDYVQCLFKRHPGLASTRLTKMKKVLDFLYDNEFTPDQVCLAPYILRANINTLKHRLQQFTDLGYRPMHLHSLCSSTKEHQRLVKQLNGSIPQPVFTTNNDSVQNL